MKKGLTTFYLDLVLPIGDHTFTIETDRESTTKTVVVEVPQVTSSQEHSVEISWLRSTSHGQYEHIGHENILEYTLKTDDCGKYLKANIRYCLSGEEMFCVFDVSQMVKPAYPSLFDLRIVGPCVEGEVVTAVYKYHGGKEGNSVIRYGRLFGRFSNFPLLSCINCLDGLDALLFLERNIPSMQMMSENQFV